MATNMALKRAKKAQRRKQVVAEKRKLEVFASSLEGMVNRAAALPIQHCLLTEAIFRNGLGILVVARGLTPEHVGMATFLIDMFCLGSRTSRSSGLEPKSLHSMSKNWERPRPWSPSIRAMDANCFAMPSPGRSRRVFRRIAISRWWRRYWRT